VYRLRQVRSRPSRYREGPDTGTIPGVLLDHYTMAFSCHEHTSRLVGQTSQARSTRSIKGRSRRPQSHQGMVVQRRCELCLAQAAADTHSYVLFVVRLRPRSIRHIRQRLHLAALRTQTRLSAHPTAIFYRDTGSSVHVALWYLRKGCWVSYSSP
jgi:hypothetical protein